MNLDELANAARTQKDTLSMLRRLRASDELIRRTAEGYIAAHYAWQKARYGKVRSRLSVSALLR